MGLKTPVILFTVHANFKHFQGLEFNMICSYLANYAAVTGESVEICRLCLHKRTLIIK